MKLLNKSWQTSFYILFSIFILSCTNKKHISIIDTNSNSQYTSFLDTNTTPEFNWAISSPNNNVVQSYYNIKLFEETPNNDILVWESGKINSDQSQRIVYTGEQKLIENNKYYWTVKVGANNGSESKWSSKSYIHTLPNNIKSKAEWIGAIDIKDSNIPEGRNYHGLSISSEEGQKWQQTNPLSKRSIYLRKNFTSEKEIHTAIVYISGLGHYELSINGDKVGDAQFNPMWSDYDKTVYFNAFDVTNILKDNNSIGVLLGNGFFNEQGGRYAKMQVSFGPPTLFFKMHVTYKDGSTKEIVSDMSWKYSPSPITYNDMYGGENYDAQLEQLGWNTINFNDESWSPVVIQNGPKGVLRFQTADPIKIMKTYSAKEISRVKDSYIFDMGQNLSGFPKIRVKGNKGDKISIKVGESLNKEGLINQAQSGGPYYYEYTLKGSNIEEWQPRFSYYGYKYIQVEGAKPKNIDDNRSIPVIESIESQFVHNSTNTAGSFKCSNEIFTKTHELVVNAMKSNMHAVFTDCPHREKLGWLEQVHLNGPGLFYNFDLTKFIPKVMQDIRDAQLENGLVPDIAPEYVIFEDGFRDSPEWGSSAVILPFMYYKFYGDNSLIINYYDVMKNYVDYLSSTATDHIVSHGLGDWCDYRENEAYGVSHNTPIALSATTHYYMVIDYLVQASEIIGNNENHQYYTNLKTQVKDSFNNEFFDTNTKQYGTGSQASNSMPLFAGLVESKYEKDVLNNLIKDIEARNFRLSTGDVGNRYLYQTLANNNLNDLMYKMHNHTEVPGYGFQLQYGNTTLTELWNPMDGASWNHFMMGQIVEWFYKSLAGIQTENYSGFKNIIISPQPVGDLNYVEASYNTLYGVIEVKWEIIENKFEMDIKIPHNCNAKVYLPGSKEYTQVGSGNHKFTTTINI